MRQGTPFKDYTPDTCAEIYSIIDSHQIEALMFHDQMADYFGFLGLDGFKCMHEFHHLDESIGRRKTKRYYMKHHSRLLEEAPVDNPKAIPTDWLKYTKFDVSQQVRNQAVQNGFRRYVEWEEASKKLYEQCAARLMELGHVADYNHVNCLVEDVDDELAELYELWLRLKSMNFDAGYTESIQEELHTKYKREMRELSITKL